jgi:rhamnosyl/mannosyltransferase
VKVLQVSKFYPPHLGGIEAVARDLSAGLVRHGVQVEVLCANKHWQSRDERDGLGVRITRSASLGLWLSTSMAPGLLWELWRRRRDADVVHVHMPDPLAALAVFVARPRARLVLHWHSDVVRQRFARHLYRPLEQWLLRRADAVIATSRTYAESSPALRAWWRKVEVIPIGAPKPTPADPARVQRVRGRFNGRRIVFALGRMTYYKGWDILMKAARSLPDDVVVVIGGGGAELAQYRQFAVHAGAAHKVAFVGTLTGEGAEAYFAAAELFCVPSTSRAEAYGVAALEAMARGLPVVASDIPGSGLGWLVQHGVNGLLVPPSDPQALAAAIRATLDDPALRARLGAAGQARWAAELSAETMADRIFALYGRLLLPAAGTSWNRSR